MVIANTFTSQAKGFGQAIRNSNDAIAMINTIFARSKIEDLDFPEETMNLNKMKILGKAQILAQGQASSSAKNILNLFG